MSIIITLLGESKNSIVNGTYVRPAEDFSLRSQWNKVNDMVITWIMNTMSDEIKNGMDFVISAQQIWEELRYYFWSVNGHRVYQVLRKLHALE